MKDFEEAYVLNKDGKSLEEIRIVIADDHHLVRQALMDLFKNQSDLKVIATASDGEEAIEIAARLNPDVIIMDITMPKINGLEATRCIKAKYPYIGILVLTVHTDNEHITGILQAGADGFLVKTASESEIIQAVRAVAVGDTVLSPAVSKQIFKYAFQYFKQPIPVNLNSLTSRELETLRLVAKGLSNKEIATRLGITTRSVKSYMTNVYQKMNVKSRTEAVALSLQIGILTLEDIE
jgi:DNA-binding NarL/FixJ family response regulator